MRTALLLVATLAVAVLLAFLLLGTRAPGVGHGAVPSASGVESGADLAARASPDAAALQGAGHETPSDEAYVDADLGRVLGALRFQPPNVPASAVRRLRELVRQDPTLMRRLVLLAMGRATDLPELAVSALPADYPYAAREAANWAVQALPAEAAPVLAELLGEVRDEARWRRWLFHALARTGRHGAVAVPTLLDMLDDAQADAALGNYVVWVLGSIGEAGDVVRERLLAMAGDPAHPLYDTAIENLYRVGGAHPEVLAVYGNVLRGGEYADREHAFRVILFQMGKDAEALRPLFTALLEDENGDVRMWAAMAMGQIGVRSGGVVARLGRMAEEESSDVETAALGALCSAGEAGQQELLRIARRAEYYETAVNALYHLGHTGYPVREHPDLLLSLLRDAGAGVRGNLVALLSKIEPGPRAADFLPFLRQHLRDPDSPLRAGVLWIATNLEADATGSGMDLLLEGLADEALRPTVLQQLTDHPDDPARIVAALEPFAGEEPVMDLLVALAYRHADARALLRRLAASATAPIARVRAREALLDLEQAEAAGDLAVPPGR